MGLDHLGAAVVIGKNLLCGLEGVNGVPDLSHIFWAMESFDNRFFGFRLIIREILFILRAHETRTVLREPFSPISYLGILPVMLKT